MTDIAHTVERPGAFALARYFALGAVFESQMQAVGSDDIDRGHVNELGHAFMLRERRDAFERLTVSGAVPVRLEFSLVERGPFLDEPHSAVG